MEEARRSVMVVDDDPRLRRAFAWALEQEFDVVVAGNVEDALKTLAAKPEIDLVLCDLMLDGQMGIELLNTLTRLNDPRAERFVLMTAYDPGRMGLPPVPTLLKPFTVAALRQTLAGVLA